MEEIDDINRLLCKKWTKYARFDKITSDTMRLKNLMIKYSDCLQNKAREVGKHHTR